MPDRYRGGYERERRQRDWDDRDRDDRYRDRPRTRPQAGSSLPGILSFGLSLVVGPGVFLLFLIAGLMASSGPGGPPPQSPAIMILGALVILALALMVVGLVLGIVGLVMPANLKVFAVLGTVFNALLLLGVGGLLLIGALLG
jgi:hypothetical protein